MKKNGVVMILTIITIISVGVAIYFGMFSSKKCYVSENANANINFETNKEENTNVDSSNNNDADKIQLNDNVETNQNAVAFCEANKDKIYNKIVENRRNSLAAKYDNKLLNSLYKLSSKDDLNCNYAVDNGNSFYKYLLYFENTNENLSDYVIFDENFMLKEYVSTIDDDYEINESFAMSLAYEIIGNKLVDTNDMYYSYILNIYDKDLVLLEAVNYDVENQDSGISNLLSLYLVDLKTKTYEKIK